MTINELSIGGRGVIVDFKDDHLGLVLNELGFFLGETVELASKAPFGDPLCIKTEETLISIRQTDAKAIVIKKR